MRNNMKKYTQIQESQVHPSIRFDCPERCQGQAVVVEYGTLGSATADDGAPFKRIKDTGEPVPVWQYYRLSLP